MIEKIIYPIYQLKVTLKRSKPPIWRRLLVPGSFTLESLHLVLQLAMPWDESHLHEFRINDEHYSLPIPGAPPEGQDERRFKLKQVAPAETDELTYLYDFGDGWEHEILVEKILPPENGVRYPLCLAGKRAAPPEDIGGIWGYGAFLEAMRDPGHPEHENYMERFGGEFDPEEFSVDLVNEVLGQIKFKK